MLNLVKSEFYKLKRSKLFIIVLLGMIAPPTFMFLGLTIGNAGYVSMEEFLNDINNFGLMMFNIIAYAVLIGYLVVREYTDHTIKTILTSPISRNSFIFGKFVVFEMLVILLAIFVYALSVIYGFIGGLGTTDLNVLGNYFIQFLAGNVLLSLSIVPFMFLSLILKNVVPAVIGGAIASFSNAILFGRVYSPLSPFCIPLMIVTDTLKDYSYGSITPTLILLLTMVVGLLLSLIYFNKVDVSL